ncbi:unnamed protein product, partial [Anisakis simplex]|uniref:Zinc transporter ZIP1 n=1 Tax=Anisakis simplex TaxID=6269 RepID=A0A0M3JFJ3_ANISI
MRERHPTSEYEHFVHGHDADTHSHHSYEEGTLADPSATVEDTHSLHHHSTDSVEEDVHFNPASHSTVRAALLVMALSLHAIFEGLSLGLIMDVNSLLQ